MQADTEKEHALDIGIGCPGRWLTLHPWRYLKDV